MLRIFIILILGTLPLFGQVLAGVLELKKETRTIFIQEKKDWKLGEDLFGLPFIYFSPQKNGQRSNISFTDTGAALELDAKTLGNNQTDFKKNKEKWAKEIGATLLSFTPYELLTNERGHKIHRIGLIYQHEKKTYVEHSNYIECRGKLVFSKSLRLNENEEHGRDFQDLLQTLDCGGV